MSTNPRQSSPLLSPEPAPRKRNMATLWLLGLAAICVTALGLQIHHFWPYMTDDAYISLRYSQRLLEGHGLTWNDLPPVEGYTNLLWVLLCAGLGGLGMNLETAAHLLGISATAAGIVAVAARVYRDYPTKVKFISALVACLALCLSAPVAVWAIGGLEQPLLAALLAWAAYLGVHWVSSAKGKGRDADVMGILLGLAVLTRADALLFTALFYAGAVLADGGRPRSLISRARLLPLPILFFIAQEIFRYSYYGSWLPNTAYVKVAFTFHRLYTGLRYDVYGMGSEIVFFALALVGAIALWIAGKKRQVIFVGTICIGWLLYILIVGGDIFPSYRHFVPAMMLMGFLAAGCGLLTLAAPFRFSMARVLIFVMLALLVLTSDLFSPLERWEPEGKEIGIFLRTAFGARNPLLAADPAGVVPYFAHMEAIDPLGLNDYHIARHPVETRGEGWVGHELGDGRYVLDHKPDVIIVSNYEGDLALAADKQLQADPRFAANYERIGIDVGPPYPRAVLYVRRIDGKLGIESSPDRESVPAYLALMDNANSVRLVDGQAQLVIPPHGSAHFVSIPLGTGSWKVELEGEGAAQLAAHPTPADRNCLSCVQADGNGSAAVTVENTSDQPAILRNLHLTRTADTLNAKPVTKKRR